MENYAIFEDLPTISNNPLLSYDNLQDCESHLKLCLQESIDELEITVERISANLNDIKKELYCQERKDLESIVDGLQKQIILKFEIFHDKAHDLRGAIALDD